jgi:hypothetical protein
MRTITGLGCWLVVGWVSAGEVELYSKKATLAETMVAVREAYDAFQQRQADAGQRLSWGASWLAGPLAADSTEAGRFVPGTLDPAWKTASGAPWWERQKQPGGTLTRGSAPRGKPVLLFNAVEVESTTDCVRTIGVHGGDAVTVWCNGQLMLDHAYDFGIADYWWHHEQDFVQRKSEWFQRLVGLPLKRGRNLVQIRIRQDRSRPRGMVTLGLAVDPDPAPRIWRQLRRDFPDQKDGFLDRVPADWFEGGASNWFAGRNTATLEQQFAECLASESGLAAQAAGLAALIELSERALLRRKCGQLARAVDELERICGRACPAAELRAEIESLRPSGDWRARFTALQKAALVTRNPLLANAEILFSKHLTYAPYHYYDEYNNSLGQRFGNSGLAVLSLKDGAVRSLVPQFEDGLVDRFDLSFDARRIVFGYQNPAPGGLRLYEVHADGGGLRQLTTPPPDEAARIARHNIQPAGNLATNFSGYATGYGHWTDDLHPCFLPDGRIAFVSTRVEQGVLCGGHTLSVPNLYRIDADGSNLTRLSRNPLSEFAPTVLNDGRIIYNRWEYVDKGVGGCQPLWAMRPDGSAQEEIYGNNITDPGVFIDGRAIPGRTDLVVCTGAAHEMLAVGPILLVDRSKDKRDYRAMTSITPEVTVSGMRARLFPRNGRIEQDIDGPVWCHPFPLAHREPARGGGSFFLAAGHGEGFLYDKTGFGLHLIDRFGNRVLLHDEPDTSCWQPVLLAPREVPPQLPDLRPVPPETPATVFLTDVYQGLEKFGVQRGEVKYLRVWEYVARPWAAHNPWGGDSEWGQMAVISKHTHLWVQVLLGLVPVNDDGSAVFRVPPNRTVFFQALDSDFQEIHRMRTPMDFKPGESRSCIGCHEYQSAPPMNRMPLALSQQPADLMPQPGEKAPRPVHYPTDVQPVWDRHCVSCHGGDRPDGDLDLTGELTLHFNQSYENLIDRDLVAYIQEFVGPKPGHGAMGNIEVVPPKQLGSHASRLVEVLKQGHYDVRLSRDEWLKVVTWVDSNAPYYGSYFGRRHIQWKNHPQFRPVPDVASARGIEPPLLHDRVRR